MLIPHPKSGKAADPTKLPEPTPARPYGFSSHWGHRGFSGSYSRSVERPAPAIHTKAQLLEFLDGAPDRGDWTRYPIPGTRRFVYLPDSFADPWDECVTTVVSWVDVDENGFPGWTRRQEICRSGDVWMIVDSRDSELEVRIVGQFADPAEGSWRCILASSQFMCGPGRVPIAPDDEVAEMEWDAPTIEELIDDTDLTRLPKRLRSLRITTEYDVELVGRECASALPGEGDWWVIPMEPADAADLAAIGWPAWPVTLRVEKVAMPAVIVALDTAYGLCLAKAHGLREVLILGLHDIALVDMSDREVSATFRRDFSDLP